IVLHPQTKEFHRFKGGSFPSYNPSVDGIGTISSFTTFIRSATEMETNNIVHATKENLPVHIVN
ncbi:MAG: hypothetical protein ACHQF2_03225, partial [Flavobacteriales bacterium]